MSLRRLKVDELDLFQLHRVDPKVDADDQFGLLAALLEEGKVRAVGLSEVSVEQLDQARSIVEIATVQNLYNVAHRASEAQLEACEAAGIGFIPWFPLNTGALAAPGGVLDEVAAQVSASPAQVALAWLLERSAVMLPIPGTSSVAHLEENCAAGAVTLSQAQFDAIADAAA